MIWSMGSRFAGVPISAEAIGNQIACTLLSARFTNRFLCMSDIQQQAVNKWPQLCQHDPEWADGHLDKLVYSWLKKIRQY